ncbi:unnamed protein product [Caenorhabditis auriculariae]|uniref:Uncharacterized protein n=1 Tax=Caenorhabditis auriculariae TaxID=2777116 RepID=A0A8S1H2I6_9PELO|nr:unnamed protein product [Caenorhabditis auriculariae]
MVQRDRPAAYRKHSKRYDMIKEKMLENNAQSNQSHTNTADSWIRRNHFVGLKIRAAHLPSFHFGRCDSFAATYISDSREGRSKHALREERQPRRWIGCRLTSICKENVNQRENRDESLRRRIRSDASRSAYTTGHCSPVDQEGATAAAYLAETESIFSKEPDQTPRSADVWVERALLVRYSMREAE